MCNLTKVNKLHVIQYGVYYFELYCVWSVNFSICTLHMPKSIASLYYWYFLSCPTATMTAMHKFLALLFVTTTLRTMASSTSGSLLDKLFHLKLLAL